MKNEYLHSKFPSQTELIGHLYERAVDDDEKAAQQLDEFLAQNKEWKKFKSDIRRGDSLWLMLSDAKSWRENKGIEGYAIVRNGKFINTFLTKGSYG